MCIRDSNRCSLRKKKHRPRALVSASSEDSPSGDRSVDTRCSRSDAADRDARAWHLDREDALVPERNRAARKREASRDEGLPERRRPSARATSDLAGDPPPVFTSIPAETRKNPKFAHDALRERRATTAARGKHATTPANAMPRSCIGVFTAFPGVRRARAACGRRVPGTTRCVTSAEYSRVGEIFKGGTARDAPWRRWSGARRARGRGGRGDRRRRWQTS